MGVATTIWRLRPWAGGGLRSALRSALRAAVLVLIGLAALAAPAGAQTALPQFPALSGRVVDEADILPDRARVELISRLATLEAKTSDQLVVVTLRSLRGRTIEQYGIALGRHWQIGQKGKNNGVLLIVAPNERKVRIEVGYGLEGVLPDAVAKYIIEQAILPHFRASDAAGGIARGADDIIRVLTGDAAEWKQRAAPFAPSVFSRVAGLPTSPGSIALGMVFAAACLLILAVIGWAFVGAVVEFLKWIGAFPKRKRGGRDRGYVDERDFGVGAYSAMPSTSSVTTGGFSGGGGDFGGGGASGSW
jgi:uncharacterized protein